MKQLTISVADEKSAFIKGLLASFSFVNLENDWYHDLTSVQKESIEKGLDDFKCGNTFTHDEVRNQVRQKIESFK